MWMALVKHWITEQ